MNKLDPASEPAAASNSRTVRGFCSKAGATLLLFMLPVSVALVWCERTSMPGDRLRPVRVSRTISQRSAFFPTGQWLADARTVVAAFHYLLEADNDDASDTASSHASTAIGALESSTVFGKSPGDSL